MVNVDKAYKELVKKHMRRKRNVPLAPDFFMVGDNNLDFTRSSSKMVPSVSTTSHLYDPVRRQSFGTQTENKKRSIRSQTVSSKISTADFQSQLGKNRGFISSASQSKNLSKNDEKIRTTTPRDINAEKSQPDDSELYLELD